MKLIVYIFQSPVHWSWDLSQPDVQIIPFHIHSPPRPLSPATPTVTGRKKKCFMRLPQMLGLQMYDSSGFQVHFYSTPFTYLQIHLLFICVVEHSLIVEDTDLHMEFEASTRVEYYPFLVEFSFFMHLWGHWIIKYTKVWMKPWCVLSWIREKITSFTWTKNKKCCCIYYFIIQRYCLWNAGVIFSYSNCLTPGI